MHLIQFEDVPPGRFYVSQTGEVWDSKRGRYLTQSRAPLANGKSGYMSVGFWMEGGKIKRKYVHRLVAGTYVPNPCGKPEVNHIDGNKCNNVASNLEWCTKSENHKHAFKLGLKLSPITYALLSLPDWMR